MADIQSIESLFSNVRRFTWSFVDIDNPSYISCFAFSVEEAKKRVLQYLQQIESLQQEKKNVDQQINVLYKTNTYEEVRSQVTQLREQLEQQLPLIENNIGCVCTSIFEYSRNMEVYYVNGSGGKWQEMTLQELILTTDPTIKEISCVSFNSCLNG